MRLKRCATPTAVVISRSILGDNFYYDGVEAVNDSEFPEKFELPYANLDFPFYVVLGNHDYGYEEIAEWKAEFQVLYTSERWNMPARYHSFQEGLATFFGLDTNAIMVDDLISANASDQQTWLDGGLAAATTPWRFAFGHHPYISNGSHGNAGSYEGLAGIPIVSGAKMLAVMEESICGKVDVYFCGHDHNRQWLKPKCGTEFIVSGAAAKTTALKDRGNETFFENDLSEGFLLVALSEDSLRGVFYNRDGMNEFERTIWK